MSSTQSDHAERGYALYLIQIVPLLAVIAAGYLLFWQFAANMMPRMESYNLYALALVAGIASFFSPCAFPLLPSYLTFYATAAQQGEGELHAARVIRLGLFAAAGVMTFIIVLGAVIGMVGAGIGKTFSMTAPNPLPIVLWWRGIIGVLLIGLGVAQWFNLNLKPRWIESFAWHTRPNRTSEQNARQTLFLYGLGYNAAGIGCTGPILAGLILFALAQGGFQAALAAFAVFAATSGGLMLIVSLLVATSQERLIQGLKRGTGAVKQISSSILVVVGIVTLLTVLNRPFFIQSLFPPEPAVSAGSSSMAAADGASMDFAPPVTGLYAGEEVLFIHTEVSDLGVATLLSEMMGPQVIHVPQLAQTPDFLLAEVYVFTDGIPGSGPFGFQPDLFDSVPGDAIYSPLRRINLVTWQADSSPRLLDDVEQIERAIAQGQIVAEDTGIVVNMPILRWPNGQR